jgi:adenylosuccinate synthase
MILAQRFIKLHGKGCMGTRKVSIIVGLGYGDEGKGLVTDYLVQISERPIVIRFNGGQQAGHTVTTVQGHRHVFSNFGAGSLRGAPTYWSSYCTFSPEHFIDELVTLKPQAKFFLDKCSPVTTHYDILYNRAKEASRGSRRRGSTGLGFGATIHRHFKDKLHFSAGDFLKQGILTKKLQDIRQYYRGKFADETNFNFTDFDHNSADQTFIKSIQKLLTLGRRGSLSIVNEEDVFETNGLGNSYVFEGAQGILLDQSFGKKPFVTKSNTSTRNAFEILKRQFQKASVDVDVYYVTRTYLTRHGYGPFDKYIPPFQITNNENETNIYNPFQGQFRINCLNIELLNYALSCDSKFASSARRHLVITCADQVTKQCLPVLKKNQLKWIHIYDLPKLLKCDFVSVRYSFSSNGTGLDQPLSIGQHKNVKSRRRFDDGQ